MGIYFDERGIGDHTGQITWNQVVAVAIRTTADGPFAEDVFWQFILEEGGMVELPGSLVDGGALETMQRQLTGMDHKKVIEGMCSTEERVFRVWHAEEPRMDDAALLARYVALITRLGGRTAIAEVVGRSLLGKWGEEHRRYHDREHLGDCLRELDLADADPHVADVAALALFYHDAVYRPTAPDNEKRSGDLLFEDAAALGLSEKTARAAVRCVLATAHLGGAAPSDPAVDLVVDIDLSILGRDPTRLLEFEHGVREEYARVPWAYYILERGRFLAKLVASPSIFRTGYFRDRFETAARRNLRALLDSPRYRIHRWLGPIYRCFAGRMSAR